MFLKIRLKVRNFIKKHKNKLIIIILAWIIIVVINYILGHQKVQVTLNTTYAPHEVLLTSETEVPENLQSPIENLIDDYVNKCNNKDYNGAFNLLTDDCKTHVFNDSLDEFTKYASSVFPEKKRYSIQNYSNSGGYYIYNLKLIDDIITTGLTNQTYAYYEEKVAIKQEGNNLKLNVNDYMGYKELKNISEDDYLKIRIESKQQYYEHETYTVKVTNKTEKTAILYDGLVGGEIYLASGTDQRLASVVSAPLILIPGETKTVRITFAKYFDESTAADHIIFDKIRIMNDDYTGYEESEEEELNKAERTYSVSIQIQ